jgi:hypothetical protein
VRGALLLLAGSIVVSGCGGGGGDRLSQAEFVAKADAICQEYEAKLDALGQPQNEDELAEFADKAIPIAKDGREELGELNPPENQQENYDRWLEQGDRAIEIVEDLRGAAEDGDRPRSSGSRRKPSRPTRNRTGSRSSSASRNAARPRRHSLGAITAARCRRDPASRSRSSVCASGSPASRTAGGSSHRSPIGWRRGAASWASRSASSRS